MKSLGKTIFYAVILFFGAYLAASNPIAASSVKRAFDNVVSSVKDSITD